jgi:hypothetical protein
MDDLILPARPQGEQETDVLTENSKSDRICLVATPLRDGALEKLAPLPGLTMCNIFGCRHLSKESVEAFRLAKPDCQLFGVHSIESSWNGKSAAEKSSVLPARHAHRFALSVPSE